MCISGRSVVVGLPRPKCLLVAHNLPPVTGGAGIVYDNLARRSAGTVMVLTARRDHRTGEELAGWREHDARAPYRIKRIPAVRPPQLPVTRSLAVKLGRRISGIPSACLLAWSVWRLIRRHGIDVVCLGDDDAVGWLIPLCRRVFRRPVIVYSHGDDLGERRWGARRRRAYLAEADKVVTVSTYGRQQLERVFRLAPAQIEVLRNGVDCSLFSPRAEPEGLRKSLGIADDAVVIMTVARLSMRKGIDTVISALPQLAERHPRVHYCIVGGGEERHRLETLCRALGMERRVTFIGAVPHDRVPDLLALCKVFVMPNRAMPDGEDEGFGLVFLEANACGIPVVAGRSGGVPDVVKDGVNGLLVDGESVEDVATAVGGLLDDEARRSRLGEAGRAEALAFDWQNHAARFQHVAYEAVRAWKGQD